MVYLPSKIGPSVHLPFDCVGGDFLLKRFNSSFHMANNFSLRASISARSLWDRIQFGLF